MIGTILVSIRCLALDVLLFHPNGETVNRESKSSVFLQLKNTLSKLYPIEESSFAIEPTDSYPFAPRFCWKFYRPDVEGSKRFGEAIRSYRGRVRWVLGPGIKELSCIVATNDEPGSDSQRIVGYPPVAATPSGSLSDSGNLAMVNEQFVELAIADLPDFIEHLERSLHLEAVGPKSFDASMIAPLQPPPLGLVPPDFVERGMHVTWIIVQADKHQKTGGMTERRMLHFGITDAEWSTICSEALGESKDEMSQGRGADFPLLSRIKGYDSVLFEGSELYALRQECLKARARTSDPLAIRGLDKLLLMVNWARSLGGNLYMAGP
jgi:hypothetical protein